MTRTNDELRRDVAILIKQSNDLKVFASQLARVAERLRGQAEELQAAIGKPKRPTKVAMLKSKPPGERRGARSGA